MEDFKGTVKRDPMPVECKVTDYGDGFTSGPYLSQPYDPDMDFGEGDASDGGTWYVRPSWFRRTFIRFKWWLVIRKTSWYKSSKAVRRYQVSAMCNSLEGSQKRAIVRIAATGSQETSSRPNGIKCDKSWSRPNSRQSPNASQTSPKSRSR